MPSKENEIYLKYAGELLISIQLMCEHSVEPFAKEVLKLIMDTKEKARSEVNGTV